MYNKDNKRMIQTVRTLFFDDFLGMWDLFMTMHQ